VLFHVTGFEARVAAGQHSLAFTVRHGSECCSRACGGEVLSGSSASGPLVDQRIVWSRAKG